jgi:hypothetical protein
MKRIAFLAVIFLTAGALKSQAPVSHSPVADLQTVIGANKDVIDAQAKTLELLNALDENAQQLKAFGKRG